MIMAGAGSSVRPSSFSFSRAIVVVLDGAGVGALPDASEYADEGSNTLGNIARHVDLLIPTLRAMGLGNVVDLGGSSPAPLSAFGRMAEASPGKDSVTGHWELTGVVLDRPFPLFVDGFPLRVIADLERRIGYKTLGNSTASGTEIIERLGREHLETGSPIVYTSADSVCQIAAHESIMSVPELYRCCEIAFEVMVEGLGVGRIIARPFAGEVGDFQRTARRRDFTCPAPVDTLFDRATAEGFPVVTIGKVDDLFAGRGISKAVHTSSDDDVMDALESTLTSTPRGIIMANLVDFDTVYGHRNDVLGYAANLEQFDRRLTSLLPHVQAGDLFIITADHGNDPTTPGTDHSREYVPVLISGSSVRAGTNVGTRSSFADVGQTIAEGLGLKPLASGMSFLSEIALEA